MKARGLFTFITGIIMTISYAAPVFACDSCAVPRLGRISHCGHEHEPQRFFVDFTFEQQIWDELDPHDAHELHEEGRHVHNKSHEEFYTLTAGVTPWEPFTVLVQAPYVSKSYIEIEDHDRLGEKEVSEGFGDVTLIGSYLFLKNEAGHLGVTGGVKFPTGETDGENAAGEPLEIELQPGSGSYDYPVGGVYRWTNGPVEIHGNVIYVIKTEGDRQFEYGDLFTASVFVDYVLNPGDHDVLVKIGADLNYQHEEKQKEEGETVEDSGSDILFVGPTLNIEIKESVNLFCTILFPVLQDQGGVHQELDCVWSAGVKVGW